MIPDIELQSPETIEKFQESQLQNLLDYLSEFSPFYKNLFAKEKIDTKKIKSLADLHHIPLIDKSHLQHYNNDFICINNIGIVINS